MTPIRVNGSKRLKYYVTMAGPDVLCVSTSPTCQEIVKRMEREASFTYQKLTLPEESAANMLYINGTIVHRSPTEIPEAYKVNRLCHHKTNKLIQFLSYLTHRL